MLWRFVHCSCLRPNETDELIDVNRTSKPPHAVVNDVKKLYSVSLVYAYVYVYYHMTSHRHTYSFQHKTRSLEGNGPPFRRSAIPGIMGFGLGLGLGLG